MIVGAFLGPLRRIRSEVAELCFGLAFGVKCGVLGEEFVRRVGELDEKTDCRGGFVVCWKS